MKMLDMLMTYENGELESDLVPVLFQNLIDSGLIFHLQGNYLREVRNLIDAGVVTVATADIEE